MERWTRWIAWPARGQLWAALTALSACSGTPQPEFGGTTDGFEDGADDDDEHDHDGVDDGLDGGESGSSPTCPTSCPIGSLCALGPDDVITGECIEFPPIPTCPDSPVLVQAAPPLPSRDAYLTVRFVETAAGPRVVAATTSAVDIIRAMPDGSLAVDTVAFPVGLQLTGVADLNGDGQDDLLLTGHEVLSLLADGAGSFAPATVVPQTCFQPSLVHWGLDDPIDLVCWLFALPPFVLDGSGEGTFSVGADVPTLADATATVADLDGDGRSELVRVQGLSTDWLPIPPGGAEAVPLLPRSSSERDVYTLATNDGPETVVALTEVGGFPGWALLEAVHDGAVFRYSISKPSSARADDVDRDGNDDLVFTAGAPDSPLFAILGAPSTDDGASPLGCLQIYELPEPATTSSGKAFGDLDGDGQLELFSSGSRGLQHFVLE